jgi:hypothetical protein
MGNMTPFTMKCVRFLAGPSDAFPGGAEDWRPLLRIKLRSSDGKEVRLPAWIDSGCDICLFPLKFALALGLEPSQMIKCSTRAFNGPVQETYFHPITLILFYGKVEYEAEVGFSAGLDQDGCALLGFEGFFDRFVVKFDGPARTFEVSPTRPEDVKA